MEFGIWDFRFRDSEFGIWDFEIGVWNFEISENRDFDNFRDGKLSFQLVVRRDELKKAATILACWSEIDCAYSRTPFIPSLTKSALFVSAFASTNMSPKLVKNAA